MIRRFSRVFGVLAFAAFVAACGPKEGAGPPVGVSDRESSALLHGDPILYSFDSLDDRLVSSTSMRGKPTVITFVTTGELMGQAQVDFLVAMAKTDGDTIHYALVALHPRKEISLVDAYAKTLGVTFPVAIADPASMSAGSPFGEIVAVPTTVILGSDGHLAWKHTGLAKSDELRAHMRGL